MLEPITAPRGAAALHLSSDGWMSITEVFGKLSVRARIVALGVIPVVGFIAYGAASMTGDAEVGHAFESVHRDTAVVDASSDLKAGL